MYLEGYKGFKENIGAEIKIDLIWEKRDLDRNGYMDREECRPLLNEIVKIIEPDRQNNYKPEDYNRIFDEFDEDGNGFMEKAEMSVLIRKVFQKSANQKLREKISGQDQEKLKQLLRGYTGFKKDSDAINKIDQIWAKHDIDGNGFLDENECLPFLREVKLLIEPTRSSNFNDKLF
jgi:Ca2+-binding EF-hand superfamily protein